jgi:hypothetical protein
MILLRGQAEWEENAATIMRDAAAVPFLLKSRW